MQIALQVETNVARSLHQRSPPTPESEELLQATGQLGVVLEPIHPGTEDLALMTYFNVEVPDRATAERVVARLQQCKAIEAVYIKPPDEMP